ISNANRGSSYDFLIDKFKSKLSSLRANKLSHAGRLALIKSVFSSIPVYYMSHILLSKNLIPKLTSIIRKFWWKGALNDTDKTGICFPGLGIRDLQMVNKSLIIQTTWRILTNPDDLLSQVLKGKYFPHTSFWKSPVHIPKSHTWSSI
uniref:Reverse transcriptase n=1 Tax=Oryza brachyantha TaxID=4533 RepID=J3L038_ORYBR